MHDAFAIFWETLAIGSGAPPLLPVVGAAFVAVGLYLIAGRFFWDASVRARTRYAVTDSAAYVVVAGFRGAVYRYAGSALDDVSVQRKPDGSGTLRFGRAVRAWSPFNGLVSPCTSFEAIRDVDGAYDAVQAAGRR